jgi:hypothetical protein
MIVDAQVLQLKSYFVCDGISTPLDARGYELVSYLTGII